MDGRLLLGRLVAASLQGVPLNAAEFGEVGPSVDEIQRAFDALLAADCANRPDRLDSLRELLDNDSAYRCYPRAYFSQLNRLRELLLDLF
jgi:hypothetical protein